MQLRDEMLKNYNIFAVSIELLMSSLNSASDLFLFNLHLKMFVFYFIPQLLKKILAVSGALLCRT